MNERYSHGYSCCCCKRRRKLNTLVLDSADFPEIFARREAFCQGCATVLSPQAPEIVVIREWIA